MARSFLLHCLIIRERNFVPDFLTLPQGMLFASPGKLKMEAGGRANCIKSYTMIMDL